ncbi:MAG TPA: TonB-dependent receptor plug domain-containing protein, partial [Flavobacteriaceae bacterium]|nr:TonB-dependent receptor plug domain-containing protein [Flavobacteriaceae bacterium]
MQTRGSFLLFFFLFLIVVSVSASEVRGVVKDRETGELLVGATVAYTDVETGKIYYAISGLDGSYKISNIPAGEYRYHISYVGYGESSGIRTVTQDMMIRDEFLSLDNTLDEVVLISDNRGTDAQARTIEKESVNVINVISAKQIQLSPDITVANVIQRVSGLSIERSGNGDPQYAIIRGMDKRYNNTLVNGIKIPSPDNENRYVPLDIFPAVFLERLEV